MTVAHPRIRIDPAVRFGKPTIRGSRLCVHDLLLALAAGDPVDVVTAEYETSVDDVRAALRFAADVLTYRPVEAEYARRMGPRPTGIPLDGDDADEAGPALIAAE